jgi:hypothetical protein
MPLASAVTEVMKHASGSGIHSSSPANSSAHHAGEATVKSTAQMLFATPEVTRPVPTISRSATGETKQMKHGDFEDRFGQKKFENPCVSLATCRPVGARDGDQGDEARWVSRLQHRNKPGIESGRQSMLGISEAERYRLIESMRLTFGRGSGRPNGVKSTARDYATAGSCLQPRHPSRKLQKKRHTPHFNNAIALSLLEPTEIIELHRKNDEARHQFTS